MQKIINYLLLLFLFLLPLQTRWIWHYGELNKGYWEYGTFSIYATEILLWVILLLFFVQNFIGKDAWAGLLANKKAKSLVLFLLFFGLSAALSVNFWVSYNFVFHILEGMALFVVLSTVIPAKAGIQSPVNLDSRFRGNDRAIALWLGAVAQGALAISQFLNQHIFASSWLGMAEQSAKELGPSVIEFANQRWLRAYGSFGSPNSLGIYLAVLFVLGLILYLKAESGRNKILISAGQLFILSGLLLSFSRGAWLAAAVGIVSLLVVISTGAKRNGEIPYTSGVKACLPAGRDPSTAVGMTLVKDFAKQISFASAVIIFWVVIFYPVFTARFDFGNRLEAKSISERQNQYAEAFSFIKSNPILGVGPGAYTYALYKKYPTLSSWQYQPIHDIYLLAVVEVGLAGFIFLFFLFKRLFGMIIKNNLIYAPAVATLIFSGIFDHWLVSMFTGIIFWWVVWGVVYADNSQIVDIYQIK